MPRAEVVRDELYKVEPVGLGKPSDVMDKLDRVCTTDFETGHSALTREEYANWQARVASSSGGRLDGGASASTEVGCATSAVEEKLFEQVVVVASAICEAFCGVLAEELEQELYGMSAIERERWLEALQSAILDSGASQTYVTKHVKLKNAVPGSGSVRVANGKREKIAEKGDLGPLTGARKVNSFHEHL